MISAEPESADIYYMIGEIYRQQGKYTEALKELNQAIKINPDFAPAYLSRARTNLAKTPRVISKQTCSMRQPWIQTLVKPILIWQPITYITTMQLPLWKY